MFEFQSEIEIRGVTADDDSQHEECFWIENWTENLSD